MAHELTLPTRAGTPPIYEQRPRSNPKSRLTTRASEKVLSRRWRSPVELPHQLIECATYVIYHLNSTPPPTARDRVVLYHLLSVTDNSRLDSQAM